MKVKIFAIHGENLYLQGPETGTLAEVTTNISNMLTRDVTNMSGITTDGRHVIIPVGNISRIEVSRT